MPERVTEAFLLCGGDSDRMGFPKEMLRVDGMPLAAAMVQRLQTAFDRVALVGNHPDYLRHWVDVPIHTDEYPGLGPMAGIHAGLRQCIGGRAFFLSCDTPLVTPDLMRRVADAAAASPAPTVAVRTPRGPEPLCGVYSTSLIPELEGRLQAQERLGVVRLLDEVGVEWVEVAGRDAQMLRDVDEPKDLWLLKGAFDEVEPLPVRRCPVVRRGGPPLEEDIVVDETPFALHVNGVHLVTVLAMPNAVRELTVGFLAYMGLVGSREDLGALEVDYEAGRISVEAAADESDLRNAVRLQISSTCGASVFGPALPQLAEEAGGSDFQIDASHLLSAMRGLRSMAPVFSRTGATHQAAFTDGERVIHFYEDVGRHNAIDKVIGRALMEGTDLTRGALLATGRLNAEMVVKALRQRVPVAATRSAVTSHALRLAEERGVTVVGFARGGRLNAYTHPDRVRPG